MCVDPLSISADTPRKITRAIPASTNPSYPNALYVQFSKGQWRDIVNWDVSVSHPSKKDEQRPSNDCPWVDEIAIASPTREMIRQSPSGAATFVVANEILTLRRKADRFPSMDGDFS
jgi:hypothetical protein